MNQAPVSARALSQRIDRKLHPERLRAARGKARAELGDYFIAYAEGVRVTHIFLEALGRELGVLQSWECLGTSAKK